MDLQRLPRYFLNRADGLNQSPAGELIEPVHIVDCFFIEARNRAAAEYLITVDNIGNLQAVPAHDKNNLPMALQAELSFHELSNRTNLRRLTIDEFYLFNIQLLEQPTNTPGFDDPIYLYGSLSGPFPTVDNSPAPIFEGQLTVTRADLLGGFLQGVQHCFCYTSAINNALTRCLHLMLAADRDEEIRLGRGIVLAYPLMPPELIVDNISNEFNSCQLLYDVLNSLKEDLAKESMTHPLREIVLPVPNRLRLEQQLKAEGYLIKGDSAIKQSESGGALGLISSLVGALAGNRVTLPPEGKIADYLQIAQTTISALPGWPPMRLAILRYYVKNAAASINQSYTTPPVIKIPSGGPLTETRLKPAPRPQLSVDRQEGPPNWMQDFISAHKQSGAKSRLTSMSEIALSMQQTTMIPSQSIEPTTPKKKTQQLPAQSADWMSDFDASASPAGSSNQRAQSEPKQREHKERKQTGDKPSAAKEDAARPNWMDDFE